VVILILTFNFSTKVLPCGIATSLDIGLSNLSFKTLTLSFYSKQNPNININIAIALTPYYLAMCKSSSLAFVLLFAFLFKLEQPTWRLIGIIGIITVGVLLMVLDESEFDLTGFIEVMIATMCGGLRWSLTQILLQKESLGMTNPAASLVFLTPIMFFSLLILSGPIEKPWELFYLPQFFGTFWVSLRTLGYMSIGGILAFCMVMSEFALISKTSVITLSVAGIFKEVLTLMLSGAIFGDKFTIVNITGLIIALFGIFLYNVLKFNSGNSGHGGHGGGSSKFDSLQLDEDHHLDEYERLAPNTAPGMNMAPFIPPKSRHSLDDIVLQTRSPQN
jgi:solute carrier family 35 protein C2